MQSEKRRYSSHLAGRGRGRRIGETCTKAKGEKVRTTGSHERSNCMKREEDLAIREEVKGTFTRLPSGVFP